MKSTSMTRQAIVAVLLTELFCAIAFSGTALFHEWQTRLRALDVMLQGRSDSLLGAIQDAEDPEANVTIDPSELAVPSEDVFAVYNRDGRLLGASSRAPAVLTGRQRDGYSNRTADRSGYRVLQRDAVRVIDRPENGGVGLRRPVTILYAVPSGQIWHEILEAASFYVLISFALFLLTAAFMILLLRRVMRPIGELASLASAVSFRSLRFEPPPSATRVLELRPLAETLSATVARLRQAVDKEQRFVSDAAHELKTGVAVVRSTIQVLMMSSRSPQDYAEGLERLLEDNMRVEELVSRMLTLASSEQKTDSQPPTINLAQSVQSAVANLQSFATMHSIELVTAIAEHAPVRLSREEAEVVTSNLVVNALQHSSHASRVEISLTRFERSVVLQVQDFGVGISPEALPRVFDRFYREDASRSRKTGGVGLGLSICKSIVEAADGSIVIESAMGAGTTVKATFNLA